MDKKIKELVEGKSVEESIAVIILSYLCGIGSSTISFTSVSILIPFSINVLLFPLFTSLFLSNICDLSSQLLLILVFGISKKIIWSSWVFGVMQIPIVVFVSLYFSRLLLLFDGLVKKGSSLVCFLVAALYFVRFFVASRGNIILFFKKWKKSPQKLVKTNENGVQKEVKGEPSIVDEPTNEKNEIVTQKEAIVDSIEEKCQNPIIGDEKELKNTQNSENEHKFSSNANEYSQNTSADEGNDKSIVVKKEIDEKTIQPVEMTKPIDLETLKKRISKLCEIIKSVLTPLNQAVSKYFVPSKMGEPKTIFFRKDEPIVVHLIRHTIFMVVMIASSIVGGFLRMSGGMNYNLCFQFVYLQDQIISTASGTFVSLFLVLTSLLTFLAIPEIFDISLIWYSILCACGSISGCFSGLLLLGIVPKKFIFLLIGSILLFLGLFTTIIQFFY